MFGHSSVFGGGGALPSDLAGSVLFLNNLNKITTDGSNFKYDNVNKRLGVGITTPLATIHAKGNSDSVGNIFVAENLSNTSNLTLANNGILTHTFTNTDYSAIDTGYSIQFKRTANTGLRLGTLSTLTATYNSSSNLSIIQAQHNNAASVLQINPYGGDTHIGSRNNKVVIGNPTLNSDSTQSVIICGGDSGYGAPALIVGLRGDGINGIRFWGYGNDGQYFNSMIRGYGDNILFRQQLIQIGNANPYAYLTTASTNSRLEINVAHRTMVDSSTSNLGNTYYQRFSWIKGSAAADMYSYMMIGSHAVSTMGMQMKVSADAVTFTNGNITLNPFGGNVGVGIATAPTASLHIKGNATITGSGFLVQNLSNVTNFEVLNSSVSSVRIGVNNLTTVISGGSSSATDYTLQVLRGVGGIGIRTQLGVPILTTIEATNNLEIISLDNSYIAIGNHTLLRSAVINISQTYSALATGYGFTFGSARSGIRFGDSIGGGFGKVPYLMQVVSNNQNEAGDLKINPFGGNVGIGLANSYLIVPTALVDLEGSTTTRASLRIRSGSAPTSPNDGDIWNSGTDLFVRLGGTTYTLVKV